jgi:uncharacterized protein (TIGR02118 family)
VAKLMLVLYRRPDTNREEFRSYWHETHGPLVAKMPGVRYHVQNHALFNPLGGEPDYDGIAEIRFESPDALRRAMTTPEAQAVFADLANFADGRRTQICVVDEIEA